MARSPGAVLRPGWRNCGGDGAWVGGSVDGSGFVAIVEDAPGAVWSWRDGLFFIDWCFSVLMNL